MQRGACSSGTHCGGSPAGSGRLPPAIAAACAFCAAAIPRLSIELGVGTPEYAAAPPPPYTAAARARAELGRARARPARPRRPRRGPAARHLRHLRREARRLLRGCGGRWRRRARAPAGGRRRAARELPKGIAAGGAAGGGARAPPKGARRPPGASNGLSSIPLGCVGDGPPARGARRQGEGERAARARSEGGMRREREAQLAPARLDSKTSGRGNRSEGLLLSGQNSRVRRYGLTQCRTTR